MFVIPWKCPSKILEGGSQKLKTENLEEVPSPPPPFRSDSFIYQLIAFDLRISNM